MPVGGGDEFLGLGTLLRVLDAEDVFELFEDLAAQARAFGVPVDGRLFAVLHRGRGQQDVERALARRGHGRIGARGVADIDRRVVGQGVVVGDVGQVLGVVGGGVDGVVGQVDFAVEAEVEHGGRAGVFLAVQGVVAESLGADGGGDEIAQGPGGVGVDDHGVVAGFLAVDHHAGGLAAGEGDPLDGGGQADLGAQVLGAGAQRPHHGVAAALGVPHAVGVLDVGQDGEEARAVEGRHAQVLALEAHGQADVLVLDVAGDVVVHALVRAEPGQGLEHGRVEQVGGAEDRLAEDRLEHVELGAVLVDEGLEAGGVLGRVRSDPLGHLPEVLRGVEHQRALPLAPDHQAVHRVQTGHREVVRRLLARGGEDLVEDVGHQKEGRPAVEAVGAPTAPRPPGSGQAFLAGAAADVVVGLVDGHAAAAGGQEDRGREPAGSGSHDGDAAGGVAGLAGLTGLADQRTSQVAWSRRAAGVKTGRGGRSHPRSGISVPCPGRMRANRRLHMMGCAPPHQPDRVAARPAARLGPPVRACGRGGGCGWGG